MPGIEPLPLDRLERHLRETRMTFTHLDRVVYPATDERGALLKAHLVDFYLQVEEAMLPHVRDRPLVFRRYPDGVTGGHFYTKNWRASPPPAVVDTVEVWSESRGARMLYAVANRSEAVAWIPQTGAVEVHPWLSRVGPHPSRCKEPGGLATPGCGLDRPDLLAFDVDPYVRAGRRGRRGAEAGGEPGVSREDWDCAREAALHLRDLLRELRLPAFPKTSGKRGLHVLVPIEPEHAYGDVRAFARTLGAHLAARHPGLVTLSYEFGKRAGKVFLDCNQNARGKTLAAPYSLRPTPQATVSAPLAWGEVEDLEDPSVFDIETVPERLRAGVDPWRGMGDQRGSLSRRMDLTPDPGP